MYMAWIHIVLVITCIYIDLPRTSCSMKLVVATSEEIRRISIPQLACQNNLHPRAVLVWAAMHIYIYICSTSKRRRIVDFSARTCDAVCSLPKPTRSCSLVILPLTYITANRSAGTSRRNADDWQYIIFLINIIFLLFDERPWASRGEQIRQETCQAGRNMHALSRV